MEKIDYSSFDTNNLNTYSDRHRGDTKIPQCVWVGGKSCSDQQPGSVTGQGSLTEVVWET